MICHKCGKKIKDSDKMKYSKGGYGYAQHKKCGKKKK